MDDSLRSRPQRHSIASGTASSFPAAAALAAVVYPFHWPHTLPLPPDGAGTGRFLADYAGSHPQEIPRRPAFDLAARIPRNFPCRVAIIAHVFISGGGAGA